MASAPPKIVRKIARRHNLDPAAVWAVASAESGGNRRAVGDAGTSFGWWQLHRGGALPAGKGLDWAASRAGINYALRQMAASGAAGLRGKAAITAIVRNFERPAAPGAEIARAVAAYGGSAAGATGRRGAAGPHSSSAAPSSTNKDALALALIQGLQSGQPLQPTDVVGLLSEAGSGPASSRQRSAGGPGASSIQGRTTGIKASKIAARQLGQPYVWGGESRKEGGFDCSGLIQWTYAKLGVNLPRTAAEQGRLGKRVSFKKLRPGDLISANDGSHIVMYVGHGRVIAAPHRGDVVHYQPVSLFRSGYTARRIL